MQPTEATRTCIAYNSPLEFVEENLESRSIVVGRLADDSELPTADEVIAMLANPLMRAQAVRVITEGVMQSVGSASSELEINSKVVTDLLDWRAVRTAFRDGSTIVVEDVSKWHLPTARLCNRIFNDHWMHANAGIFMTRRSHAGFPFHADEEVSFVFQLEGSKRWRVADYPASRLGGTQLRANCSVVEFTLARGDVACIPRMYPHSAEVVADGSDSAHLTVGVRRFAIKDAFGRLANRGATRLPVLQTPLDSPVSSVAALADAVSNQDRSPWLRELAIATILMTGGTVDGGFVFTSEQGDTGPNDSIGDLLWRVSIGDDTCVVYHSGTFGLMSLGAAQELASSIEARQSMRCSWREYAQAEAISEPVADFLKSAGWELEL